jgi:uncharacterized membrane protein
MEETEMAMKRSNGTDRGAGGTRPGKKEKILQRDKKSRVPALAVLVCCALVAALAVVFFMNRSGERATVLASTQDIRFPAETFADGKARHYRFDTQDKQSIHFFVLKSSDGVIRAAFDACDVCWRERLGYYQDGDHMVCRNCGQRFASVKVNEVRGGCNPAPLERTVVNGQLVIQTEDILKGKKYFDFSSRS